MADRTTRRDALRILGAAGAAALGCGGTTSGTGGGNGQAGAGGVSANGPCIVRPVQTEGPYFVDAMLNRADIRADPSDGTVSEGTPLRVVLRVYRIDGSACVPINGAMVDLWQCDALGIYSGVLDGAGAFDTTGRQFLRGYQLTDESGTVEFVSIYPGYYTGRTVHLHFKVRTDPTSMTGLEFTSQLYFDDRITDIVMARAPYNQKTSPRIRNEQDGIFLSGGSELMLALREDGLGYEGTLDLALNAG